MALAASENMGCDFMGGNFCTLFSLFCWFGYFIHVHCSGSLSHNVKFYSFMFMLKISTRVVCVKLNGKHPMFWWLFWTDSWQAIEKLWYLFHVLVQVKYPHRYLYLQIDYLIAQSRETARLPGRTIIPLQHLGNCGHLSYNNVKTSSLTHPETEHKV